MNDFFHLRDLILGEEADDIEEQLVQNSNPGSVLNPSNLDGTSKDKKQLAPPHAKIEIKQGEKNFTTTQAQHIENEKNAVKQPVQQEQPVQEKKKKAPSKNDIWEEEEVKDLPVQQDDHRERPDIETMFKQKVGTEDVYFGMNNIDPTSTKCQELLVKILMPRAQYREIQLDINSTGMVVQSPQYYVHHIFPYPVKDKDGKAQWISDKHILQLTLPIIREELY